MRRRRVYRVVGSQGKRRLQGAGGRDWRCVLVTDARNEMMVVENAFC